MKKLQIVAVCLALVFCLLANSCKSMPRSGRAFGNGSGKSSPLSKAEIGSLIAVGNELLAAGDMSGGFNRLYAAAVAAENLQDETVTAAVAAAREAAWKNVVLQEVRRLQPVAVGQKLSGSAVFSVMVNNMPAAAFPLAVAVKDDRFSAVTAADGTWSVAPKTPEKSGIYRLSVRVDTAVFFADADFSAEMTAFAATDPVVPAVESDFRVHTADKTSPTSICIMDFDKNDKPIIADKDATASSLLFDLIVKKNFGAIGMSQFNDFMIKRDYNGAAAAADVQFGGTVRRFICGTTKITSVARSGEDWTATASAEIYVYNLTTKEVMLSVAETAETKAASENAAISAVRRILGESVIADALYYGL